jgi:hypothetical protein
MRLLSGGEWVNFYNINSNSEHSGLVRCYHIARMALIGDSQTMVVMTLLVVN